MKRLYRLGISVAALVLVILLAAALTRADDTASGTVSIIESKTVAAGVGVNWGDGTLIYNSKKYPFSLKGLEVVGVGYADVKAEGTVSNLTQLSDFEGVYGSAEASATAGTGLATVTLKNPHGVKIVLHAVQD